MPAVCQALLLALGFGGGAPVGGRNLRYDLSTGMWEIPIASLSLTSLL